MDTTRKYVGAPGRNEGVDKGSGVLGDPGYGAEQPGKDGFELHSLRCDCELCEGTRVGFGEPIGPMTRPLFSEGIRGVPMDAGLQREVCFDERGFYRSYSAFVPDGLYRPGDVPMEVCDPDVRQITAELERESPVTGTVAFRLVGGRLVAALVSYTAFA